MKWEKSSEIEFKAKAGDLELLVLKSNEWVLLTNCRIISGRIVVGEPGDTPQKAMEKAVEIVKIKLKLVLGVLDG